MSEQVEIHLDIRTGEVLRRATYDMVPGMAYFRSQMARLHLGMLYGDLNWWQNFVAALVTLVLSVSGFVAWWARRPAGSLGVPKVPANAKVGAGLLVLIVILGVFFPLMGATLIAALILDWLVLRRIGWFQPA